jgi:hemerythrin-like domain-containing protein
MINLLAKLSQNTNEANAYSSVIAMVVDFLRTYADACHHGKEEDILFRDLAKKQLSHDHEHIMNSLIEEHCFARATVGKLVDANREFSEGRKEFREVEEHLKTLVEFYPRHIEKEDEHFFPINEIFRQAGTGAHAERILRFR